MIFTVIIAESHMWIPAFAGKTAFVVLSFALPTPRHPGQASARSVSPRAEMTRAREPDTESGGVFGRGAVLQLIHSHKLQQFVIFFESVQRWHSLRETASRRAVAPIE